MQAAVTRGSTERPHSLAQTSPSWQQAQAQAITDPAQLLSMLELPETLLPAARRAHRLFGLRVPRGYVARMRPGDPHDPLLRQVLPLDAEALDTPGFSVDAVGDKTSLAGDGLLHKYHGRALLITTGACAIHCRYCFRRHFPYADINASRQQWAGALARIADDPSLAEIILSGGDPLSLSNRRLVELLDGLERIPHVRRIRIHSRQPIVLPERIDAGLLDRLGQGRARKIMVVHANHGNEIDDQVRTALARLQDNGVLLLNQSVLLRGVNDQPQLLAQLSERLFDNGTLPYYLHLLDRVKGTAHFEVPEVRAQSIMRELAGQVPGYLVPRLAREQAGMTSKSLLGFDQDWP